jgi:hypothetical protein
VGESEEHCVASSVDADEPRRGDRM